MVISAFSPASIWNNATRTLTNCSPAITSTNNDFVSLAGAATLDIRPLANLINITTVSAITNAAATGSIAIFHHDGTNSIQLAVSAAAANATVSFHGITGAVVGFKLVNNDATHAGSVFTSTLHFVL